MANTITKFRDFTGCSSQLPTKQWGFSLPAKGWNIPTQMPKTARFIRKYPEPGFLV
jgi:hypothetical protein